MNYTIDANVFVSGTLVADAHHVASRTFLNAIRPRNEMCYCPSLLTTEAVAAIARPTGNVVLAQREIGVIRRFPNMRLISLTIRRSRRAAQLAALYRLRGADAVYLAVAEEFTTTLITWDAELLSRGAGVVMTMTPADWLANPPALIYLS